MPVHDPLDGRQAYAGSGKFFFRMQAPERAADGYKLGSRNPDDNAIWGSNRVEVPSVVSPGQSITFKFKVRAPTKSGSYNFQWRVVQEHMAWFGATTDNKSVAVK
ncbi:hypothetical protein GCM10027430_01180 [Lysobacter tyrosinilyticus]